MSEWVSHQIVTAPMGTVFPVIDAQWAELVPLLRAPPDIEVADAPGWPEAFSWQQRTKSVTPLPGERCLPERRTAATAPLTLKTKATAGEIGG